VGKMHRHRLVDTERIDPACLAEMPAHRRPVFLWWWPLPHHTSSLFSGGRLFSALTRLRACNSSRQLVTSGEVVYCRIASSCCMVAGSIWALNDTAFRIALGAGFQHQLRKRSASSPDRALHG
jgi:hypothetical protein